MYIKITPTLPQSARDIREDVFVEEQGVTDEFDNIDHISHHLVLFEEDTPAAVSRVYWDEAVGYTQYGPIEDDGGAHILGW